MSVIAHWIEQAGISTVVIGLVRKHLRTINPPRALWVPFELGRPLGAPGNPAFQRSVLTAALEMTAKHTAQATLIDFARDDPRSVHDPNWRPPVAGTYASVSAEVEGLKKAQHIFTARHKRTAVGVAKLDITQCALLVDGMRDGEPSASPRDAISPILMARFAMDDLKSYYIEAALASGTPSSRQIHDWLWMSTCLGNQLQQLRQRLMKAKNDKLNTFGKQFIIPHRWRKT